MITSEIHFASKNKEGESICGDTMVIKRNQKKEVVSLSDGLGSGVKASILSTLTSSIASTMVFNNVPVDEVFSSILSTLPICQVRGISYATLCTSSVDFEKSCCEIIEYEFPVVLFFRGEDPVELKKTKRSIQGKDIFVSQIQVDKGDTLFMMTDGVSQAGMGTPHYPLGLGLEKIRMEVLQLLKSKIPHTQIMEYIIQLTKRLDHGIRGDDALAVSLFFREMRVVNVLVGPPENHEDDLKVVHRFMGSEGNKVVCGGTTGQILERILGKRIRLDLSKLSSTSPPIGSVEGVDLVTEGLITLTQVYRVLENQEKEMGHGSSILHEMLVHADQVNFFVGRALNPAHQNPLFSHDISLKFRLILDIAKVLEKKGKNVNIEYY